MRRQSKDKKGLELNMLMMIVVVVVILIFLLTKVVGWSQLANKP